jgi:hypothetical protein
MTRAAIPLFALVLLVGAPSASWARALLTSVSGIVQVRDAASDKWLVIKAVPQDLSDGETVRTGMKSQATLTFSDGSRIELGSNASFALEESAPNRSSIRLAFGTIKAFVQKIASRQFKVRTPTAVCSVRGTEFRVEVQQGGRTVVDLYKGLLGVQDQKGQQILLHPNERVEVDLRGMSSPAGLPSQGAQNRANFQSVMRKEMALDMSKEQVMAAAVNELKTAEFQQATTSSSSSSSTSAPSASTTSTTSARSTRRCRPT